MGATKTLSAIIAAIIGIVLVIMFLNKGNLGVGAGPKGASFSLGY